MNALAILLLIFFGGAILTYFGYKINKTLGHILVGLIAVAAPAYFFTSIDSSVALDFTLAGFDISWAFTSYAWLFAVLVVALVPLVLIYSISYMNDRDRLGWFYFNFMLSIGAMLGILMSQDLVSLFIFWEIMTWSSYLIVVLNGKDANRIGLKYILMSALGAYAMLTAIAVVISLTGSTHITDLFAAFGGFSMSMKILVGVLFLIGFAVKAAVMPLHIWAPDAYSNAPMSYTSMFSGALSKMGVYGIGLVILNLYLQSGITSIGIYLAWLGAITAAIGTFYAVIQQDAKKLLAWSSVAQLGYIVAGLGIGTKLSVFAGLYLAILHGAFKATLFMAVGAVEKQAGTTEFPKLRALIRKMPITFLTALIAVIALAGVPPLGGFVGKWMLYESMITSGHVVLVIVLFLASTAGFLYSYRFLYGMFLGQEESDFDDVKEASPLMTIPMIILALFLVVTGTLPGFVFKPIANAMSYLGFSDVTYQMSVLTNDWGQSIYLQYVTWTLAISFVLALIFLTFYHRKGTRYVSTKDIHTAGELPKEDDNFHFSLDFFRPFVRAIEPIYKWKISKVYYQITNAVEDLFQFVRRFYTGNGQTYALYVLIFMAILLLFAKDIIF